MGRREKQSAKSNRGTSTKRGESVDVPTVSGGGLPYAVTAGDGVVVNGYSEEWLGKGV